MIMVDTNRNYKTDEGDTILKSPGVKTVGAYGMASVEMTKIKVTVASSPLAEGLPAGNWIQLENKLSGRVSSNIDATVLLEAERWHDKWNDPNYKEWTPPKGSQPFLTFKHGGKGACIYIVASIPGTKLEKHLSIVLKNCLSKKTLEWLTAQ